MGSETPFIDPKECIIYKISLNDTRWSVVVLSNKLKLKLQKNIEYLELVDES